MYKKKKRQKLCTLLKIKQQAIQMYVCFFLSGALLFLDSLFPYLALFSLFKLEGPTLRNSYVNADSPHCLLSGITNTHLLYKEMGRVTLRANLVLRITILNAADPKVAFFALNARLAILTSPKF